MYKKQLNYTFTMLEC